MTLTWKIFAGNAAVVTAVLLVTLALTDRSASRASDAAITRSLASTREQVNAVLSSRDSALARSAEVFVRSAPFRAIVEQKNRPSAGDQATEAADVIGATMVQITDGDGVLLARSNDPTAPADTLARSALIGGALEGQRTSGVGVGKDGLFQAVAVPIQGAGNSTVGVLMATRKIDAALAAEIKRGAQGDVEVVFFSLDEGGKPHVAGSTLPKNENVDAVLDRRAEQLKMATGIAGQAVSDSAHASLREEFAVGEERYIGSGGVLKSAGGTILGGYLALKSRAVELAGFKALRTTILAGGLIGLVLAMVFSYLIAKQTTKPVGELVRATKAATEGDYHAPIPQGGKDEIGVLASAFRGLLADLREKQGLVELLQQGSGGITQPMVITPTMRMQAGGAPIIEPGQVFVRRYLVKEVLGAGGMGMVFKAVDQELNEPVAIKTLKGEMLSKDPSALDRFRSEIKLARRISHRNVVRTHDIGEEGGVYFITMEYVEGKSLKDLIRSRGRLPAAATITIAKQICRGLEVAHEEGIIHRDIKPQNIAVDPSGTVKIMDFGIARLAQRTEPGATQAGMVVGTPEYMAPEQLMGDEVDARADIFALGVVMYECLVGQPPIVADNVLTLITRKLETVPDAPHVLVPEVPPALGALVMRTMARDAAERPQSAEELAELLTAISEDGEGGRRTSAAIRMGAEAQTPRMMGTVR
jgi:serine/threonine-protein kinase